MSVASHVSVDPDEATRARQWATFAFARWRGRDVPVPESPLPVAHIRRLGLAPLHYRALSEAGDPRASQFLADYRHTLTANLLRLGRATRVRDALEAAGIRAVLMKGAAFLTRFSANDPALRPMSDIDVLVGAAAYPRALDVLRAEGFVAAAERYAVSAAAAPGRSFVLAGGALDLEIDLHRAVEQWPLYTRLAAATLAESERVNGWWVPAVPDAIACAAVHRARHAFVWSCLDLIDLRCLVDRLDRDGWRACVDDLARTGTAAATYAAFRQALYSLGDTAPTDRERLEMLAARLSRTRRRWLDRLAPENGAFLPRLSLDRPLTRNLIIQPVVSGSLLRPVAGALLYLPLRVADEWQFAGREGASVGHRMIRLWRHFAGGDRRVRAALEPTAVTQEQNT